MKCVAIRIMWPTNRAAGGEVQMAMRFRNVELIKKSVMFFDFVEFNFQGYLIATEV